MTVDQNQTSAFVPKNFAEAEARLKEIAQALQGTSIAIEELAALVQEAASLKAFCEERIRMAEAALNLVASGVASGQ